MAGGGDGEKGQWTVIVDGDDDVGRGSMSGRASEGVGILICLGVSGEPAPPLGGTQTATYLQYLLPERWARVRGVGSLHRSKEFQFPKELRLSFLSMPFTVEPGRKQLDQ